MARLPRLILAGHPYHVTQRGNCRRQTFFEDGDCQFYRDLLAEAAHKAGAEVWAYCLMPNHVHVIVVPSDEGSGEHVALIVRFLGISGRGSKVAISANRMGDRCERNYGDSLLNTSI
jgi:REP element-mobilizing transposase RayT